MELLETEKEGEVVQAVDLDTRNRTVCWAFSAGRKAGKGVRNRWRRECWARRERGLSLVGDKSQNSTKDSETSNFLGVGIIPRG